MVVHKLKELVSTIMAKSGGVAYLSFEFSLWDKLSKLDWKWDIKPLIERYGECPTT